MAKETNYEWDAILFFEILNVNTNCAY